MACPSDVRSVGERASLEVLRLTWQRAHTRFGVSIGGSVWAFWSTISGGLGLGTRPWSGLDAHPLHHGPTWCCPTPSGAVGRSLRTRGPRQTRAAEPLHGFAELNDRFLAWTEQVCNTRQHAETGQPPITRFTSQGPLPSVEPALLREAFRWSVVRRVIRTASVSLAGNHYGVDPSLMGRRMELRFDPEDLTRQIRRTPATIQTTA